MENTIDFLLNHGDPVIKYRTMTELLEVTDDNQVQNLKKQLVEYSKTKKRLYYLESKDKLHDFNGVHGATNYHLENSLPMLLDYGVKKGFVTFDKIMKPILERLKKQVFPEDHVFSNFINIIIFPFLYKSGFRESWIKNFMVERLDILYNFTIQKNYDIYDNNNYYKSIPTSFKNRRIIKPDLYINGHFKIPLIYDIYGLAEMSKEADETTLNKIKSVIDYILDSAYLQFDDGYGILVNGDRNYLAMGWDAKLPINQDDILTPEILHRLELMAHFKNAVEDNWFKSNYNKLKEYRSEKGTYQFPKIVLQKKTGCWVHGRHMDLGENRRKLLAYELESTFRVLKINKILRSHN
ncbi:hypothetical protein GOQ27_04545 [Clostridium sp. D2Q-11]|uniref:Uncharacterized protein n=1 Tax=Anaeromonas frigoriresistens TaxID=2683708 RepID=A0A942USD7_9FIRM|nr:hypothetical protein [Anaeromonas frigoriresistens]MBS4537718.1 hypothetical protein [Anaeromonas frigoriresistens]